MTSLYVHIPFCVRKCEYCDFYSEAAGERDIDRYLDALEREFELRGPQSPQTVFIGGGTPTRLSAPQLHRLAATFRKNVDLSACAEFTCEINPSTLTADKAAALVELGVTRASFGVQSFNDDYLRALGRIYESGTPPKALKVAREAGIKRISIDLMFALPGQTAAQFKDDLRQALDLGTEHISLYALTFEDDTPLTLDLKNGKVQACPEELEREMFGIAGQTCAEAGLQRYEVSNFAKPGAECRHNLVYWRLGDWLGVGAGAHSWLGGKIIENAADHRAYCEMLEQGRLPVARQEQLDARKQAETLLLMNLRLTEGVEIARLDALLGAPFMDNASASVDTLARHGLVEVSHGHIRATSQGLLVLDGVILELARALEHKAEPVRT